MKTCRIVIKDQVNCLIQGLSTTTAKKLEKRFTFTVPGAYHMPSYQLGRWNGKVKLFNDGWFYVNLLDSDVLDLIQEDGYELDVIDERQDFVPDPQPIAEDSFSHLEGAPMLREYQVAAANMAFSLTCGIFKMATGAGKSYVCAAVSRGFSEYGRVVVVVPSVDLVSQTAASFRALGIVPCGEFCGSVKAVERVTITTWQSLDNFPELLEGASCIIVDETHRVKASVLGEIMTGPGAKAPRRFGFTGTLPDDDLDRARVLAAMGPVVFEKTTWELQTSGVLAKSHINIVQTKDGLPRGQDAYEYDVEYKRLTHDKDRLRWVAEMISEASESGNTMVLVKNVETGRRLAELLGDKAVFVSGSTKNKTRKQEYDSMSSADGKILVCTKGIASTGIDIPRIFNLFLFEAGKNFIEVIQSIGRGLRRVEGDKESVEIYDVCSDSKYSARHMRERKKYYDDAKFRYTHLKVTY